MYGLFMGLIFPVLMRRGVTISAPGPVSAFVCLFVCLCAFVCVCARARLFVRICVFVCVCVSKCMHARAAPDLRLYVCLCE